MSAFKERYLDFRKKYPLIVDVHDLDIAEGAKEEMGGVITDDKWSTITGKDIVDPITGKLKVRTFTYHGVAVKQYQRREEFDDKGRMVKAVIFKGLEPVYVLEWDAEAGEYKVTTNELDAKFFKNFWN